MRGPSSLTEVIRLYTQAPNVPSGAFTRRRLLTAAGAAALLPVLGGCAPGDDHHAAGLGIIAWPDGQRGDAAMGKRAPNFRLTVVGAAGDPSAASAASASASAQTSLADRLTTPPGPAVVNFFASWCTSCREEMAVLQAAAQAGTTVIGVDLREAADRVRDLGSQNGITYPLLLDADGSVTRAYRVINLPGTYVLRADGTVAKIILGPLTDASLADALAAAR